MVGSISSYTFSYLAIQKEKYNQLHLFKASFKERVDNEIQTISAYLTMFKKDSNLQNAFIASDRKKLIEATQGCFDNINKYSDITHFYFITPEGKVFLRAHDTPRYGDTIKRYTFERAKELKRPFSGLEFGLKMNYTLRVVHPWIVDGQLIGYLELGKEIDKINASLSKTLNVDIYYAVDTSLFEGAPKDILEASKTLPRTGRHIIVYNTAQLPDNINTLYDEKSGYQLIDIGDKHYLRLVDDLLDISGKKLGKVLYLIDATFETGEFKKLSLWYALVMIIGMVIMLFYGRIMSRNHQRQMQRVMDTLEDVVEQRTQQLREKDRILNHQAKSAQMGEMLAMIAHQWRQPLNAVSAAAISLSLKQNIGVLTGEEIEQSCKFIQHEAQEMSEIINDFMNFFKSENEKSHFKLEEAIEDTRKIVRAQLSNRGIVCELTMDDAITLYGFKKEFVHILLNLLTNARDVLSTQTKNEKKIFFAATQQEDKITISICDTGPGIDKKIIDRIFDPYFTTKQQGEGTGIGLYMAKQMLANDFNATISVQNRKGFGACFIITIPK